MKTVNFYFGSKGIEELQNYIADMQNQLKKINNQAVNDMAELGLSEIQKNHASRIYEDGDDVGFYEIGSDTEKEIGMTGTQAIYDEFGTGTEGEANQHPIKKKFDLNEYNSGPTIRAASEETSEKTAIPQSELYWTYKNANGDIIYTTGVPAGKEVYDASLKVRDEEMNIIKKAVSDIL